MGDSEGDVIEEEERRRERTGRGSKRTVWKDQVQPNLRKMGTPRVLGKGSRNGCPRGEA